MLTFFVQYILDCGHIKQKINFSFFLLFSHECMNFRVILQKKHPTDFSKRIGDFFNTVLIILTTDRALSRILKTTRQKASLPFPLPLSTYIRRPFRIRSE